VRCALVDRRKVGASAARWQVIYVGYHDDKLWRAGWLVHEAPSEPFGAELRADLSAVGCELGL
jgi:hypothetical protein